MLAVERHYLKTYGGGFTENFYGLKRERVLQIKGGEAPRAQIGAPDLMRETLRLGARHVWSNLAVMVGLPYLKRKLDDSYDIHAPQASILGPSYNRDTLPHDASIRQRILFCYKWFLRNMYPSINATYYFSLLAFNLAYLFDNTKHFSPFLWLIGTRIRRLSEADHRAIALAAEAPSINPSRPGARPGEATSIFNPVTFASVVYPRLLSSLTILLPTSIFALKFLEWWHASDFARQLSKKATEGIDMPTPTISGLALKAPRGTMKKQISSNDVQQLAATTNSVSLSSPPPQAPQADAPEKGAPPQPTPPARIKPSPPTSSITLLPIYTVAPPTPQTSALCPICLHPIQTATSVQTGYVFCYTCIFRWVDGSHDRQIAFMEGKNIEEGTWDDEDMNEEIEQEDRKEASGSREGKWESGKGRCAITGRRVLGGTDGLRRVMV